MTTASRRLRARRFALVALALAACTPAEGPQPIAYDREPCRHCRMLISEPRFAAQLETEDGEIWSFDDPGCLLSALAVESPRVRALWFHHLHEDRWLSGARVAFVETERTPMGYGLGAVEADTSGSLSLDQARALVGERSARPDARR
jgi:copper chaperone NosL